MGCSQSFGRDGGGCGAAASSSELGGATGDGGGSLRPLRKAKAKAGSKETKCGAGRLTGARCGLCWCALARRGLSRQAARDARRHAAVNFCNRSDYCSIDSELPVEPDSVT